MKLTENDIIQHLKIENLKIKVFDCIPSTNTLVKEHGRKGAAEGLVIVAEKQTAGRGRMGREFYSPADTGVYFSILLRPILPPKDCLLITTAAAVACARVLETYAEAQAKIKWVNDIYIDHKKVCGILTEAAFTGLGTLDYAVLGIGINIIPPKTGFPNDLSSKAGSVMHDSSTDLRGKIAAEVINEFFKLYKTLHKREFIYEYRSRSMLDGMEIEVIKHDMILPATALYIDDELQLVVQYPDGIVEHLHTGDVSIKKAQ